MRRYTLLSILAFVLTSHSLNAQPQYCTVSFTGSFTGSANNTNNTTRSQIYNNRVNQCVNWALTASFPQQVTNPTLTFLGSYDTNGSPGTFTPIPVSCITNGYLASLSGGFVTAQPIANPIAWTGSGGWGNLVFSNCYFPFVQIVITAGTIPAVGTFSVPIRASGTSGVGPATPTTTSNGGSGGGGTAPSPPVPTGYNGPTGVATSMPWFGTPSGNRVSGTVYQNSTGKPIYVTITISNMGASQLVTGYSDTTTTANQKVAAAGAGPTGGDEKSFSFVVPPGFFYRVVSSTGNLSNVLFVEWN